MDQGTKGVATKKPGGAMLPMVAMAIGGIALVFVAGWGVMKAGEKASECAALESLYGGDAKPFPTISPVPNSMTPPACQQLVNCYVKSAYNCCSAGDYSNSYVSLCALKTAIRQGCRFLDFQVFWVDGSAVVSVSPGKSDWEKGTYNSIPFGDAMSTVADYAMASGGCPNSTDPLFLHFRISSRSTGVQKAMREAFIKHLESKGYLLGPRYNGDPAAQFMLLKMTSVKDVRGKIIIMIGEGAPVKRSSSLYEYVNFSMPEPNCADADCGLMVNMRRSTLYGVDSKEMVEKNKDRLVVCMPDLGENPQPVPWLDAQSDMGIQFVAMRLQQESPELETYLNYFAKAQTPASLPHAFVVRPVAQRYIPRYDPPPEPPNPDHSYAANQYGFFDKKPCL